MDDDTLQPGQQKPKSPIKIIALTCLLAGTLDILSAIIDSSIRFKITPIELFQFIASGVFGPKAFSGGIPMAIAGLLFHYFIASCWTVFFFLIMPKFKISSKYKIPVGLLYGIFVWLVMNLVVVPLSNVHKVKFSWSHTILGMLYLMFMIGLLVSVMFYKYYFNQNS